MNIRFVGNAMVDQFGNHHALPDLVGNINAGKFEGSISDPKALALSPPFLRLLPAENRGKVYSVPHIVGPEEQKAVMSAQHAQAFLERWHADARTQLGLPQ